MDTLPWPQKSTLAGRIRQARDRAGLSQAALARQLGTSFGSISQWEIGRSRPSASRLPVLAGTLGVPTSWLIVGEAIDGCAPAAVRREDTNEASLVLDEGLVREARHLGVDVPATVERHLRAIVIEARQRQWLQDNRAALAEANALLDRHGLCGDGTRLF